jgi:hypothetical protein
MKHLEFRLPLPPSGGTYRTGIGLGNQLGREVDAVNAVASLRRFADLTRALTSVEEGVNSLAKYLGARSCMRCAKDRHCTYGLIVVGKCLADVCVKKSGRAERGRRSLVGSSLGNRASTKGASLLDRRLHGACSVLVGCGGTYRVRFTSRRSFRSISWSFRRSLFRARSSLGYRLTCLMGPA